MKGTIYKLTDRIWASFDMPWPIFELIYVGVIFKIVLGGLALCLAVLVFPLIYIYGICRWIKTGNKPKWFYPFWFSFIFGWYIFCILI